MSYRGFKRLLLKSLTGYLMAIRAITKTLMFASDDVKDGRSSKNESGDKVSIGRTRAFEVAFTLAIYKQHNRLR